MGDLDHSDIWDLSPVPTLILSPSYCIQRVSNGLLSAWKRQREELVGRDLFAALYGASRSGCSARISLTRTIELAVAAQQLRLCHATYNTHNASWSARIIPIARKDGLLSLVLEWEVAETHVSPTGGEVAQNLLSVDEMFRLLVQTVKDYAIFLLDTRGYVTTWNTGAELLKGYAKDDIVGKHFSIFYGEDDLLARKPEKELETCLHDGRVEDEGWRYRKDGSRFWANIVITAVRRNGIHIGFGKVTRDLTKTRESEMRLVAAYEGRSKLKSDFLAKMSHEIRTPMHGMLSACALLIDTPLSKDQREMAELIADSGQVLLQVINDILDYSKLTSDNVSMSSGLVDVTSIISSVFRNARVMLCQGVNLKVHLSPELPKAAQGDPLRFRQIVQNLVDNAAKFTEKRHISIHTAVTEKTQRRVSDTVAQYLFTPFTQLEHSTKKRFQGTGLGLSIARSLAELMDGQMGFRPNTDSKGSVFWFSVKLGKIANGERVATADTSKGNAESYPQNARNEDVTAGLEQLLKLGPTKRLLAAEDNVINQKVLVRMLNSFGLTQIDLACDGAQAVSLLTNSSSKYDLVLMDVNMPVMDGFEATAAIRNNGIHVPILAMTAYALTGDMESCLDEGMDDYISKPMNRNILQQKLLRWLNLNIQSDGTSNRVAAP